MYKSQRNELTAQRKKIWQCSLVQHHTWCAAVHSLQLGPGKVVQTVGEIVQTVGTVQPSTGNWLSLYFMNGL